MPGPTQKRYRLRAEVWLYPGKGGWHFVTLDADLSAEIRSTSGGADSAWGSLKVLTTIGGTQWKTSLFPDSKSRRYQLPIKANVRIKENVGVGDTITCLIELGD